MMTRRQAALACTAALTSFAAEVKANTGSKVRLHRLPSGGLQPQVALDDRGILHLVFYSGDPHKGDLLYMTSSDYGARFSPPLRVNSQPGSAVAAGTIRGAQIALGRKGRLHVAWNGSNEAELKGPVNPDSGKPGMAMLYTHLVDSAGTTSFAPERNLMFSSFGLDGGGSVTADRLGNVFVAWHGIGLSEGSGSGKEGEARRSVWITKSSDDGQSFGRETKAWIEPTGACGCCGMKIFSDHRGNISALYRSATESVHRDIYLLFSEDHSRSFSGRLLHKWNINACPMSSMDFTENGKAVVAAWETGGQVYWTRLSGNRVSEPVAAPGEGKGRKHPRLALNQDGELLLAWTEGTGWQKGGSLAYQLYDKTGNPTGDRQQLAGIPAWSFPAPIARPDNGFSILF